MIIAKKNLPGDFRWAAPLPAFARFPSQGIGMGLKGMISLWPDRPTDYPGNERATILFGKPLKPTSTPQLAPFFP
jgi:hypothetical protein